MFSMFGNSVTGLVRKQNQDRFDCGLFEDGSAWAIVCDGMGGPGGGEIASKIALETIRSQWLQSYSSELRPTAIRQLMISSAEAANEKILTAAVGKPELEGMGTTLVCCIWQKNILYVLHAGDSRLYLRDPERIGLTQLTHDHSMVQNLVDQGELTEEEAANHPDRNLITKAVGISKFFHPEYAQFPAPREADLLLSSDGLTGEVSDEQIASLMAAHDTAEQQVAACIATALENGGHDNITAVILKKHTTS